VFEHLQYFAGHGHQPVMSEQSGLLHSQNGRAVGCLGGCMKMLRRGSSNRQAATPNVEAAPSKRNLSQRSVEALKKAVLDQPDVGVSLIIDIGSSSVSCIAYGPNAQPMPGSKAQVKRSMLDVRDGTADVALVIDAVNSAVDECLGFLREAALASLVRSVGFTGFVMNFFGTDGEGHAVTPVYTYADQHATTWDHVRDLKMELARDGILEKVCQETGAPLHPCYAPAQLRRLAREEPALLAKVKKWQTLSSFITARWMGRPHLPISFSEASWTGLLQVWRLQWNVALAERVGVAAETLPALADCSDFQAGLSSTYRQRWPELASAHFHLGVGDGAAAAIGSGSGSGQLHLSRIAATIGTSAAARVVVPIREGLEVPIPSGLWCYRVDRERVLFGGSMSDGGSLYEWMSTVMHLESADRGEATRAEVARMLPDEHGLTVLPFLSGCRQEPNARCTVSGITRRTTTAHMVRAGLESIALRLAAIVANLRSVIPQGDDIEIVGSGGALQESPVWQQALADASGVPVLVYNGNENLTCRGVMLQILKANGKAINVNADSSAFSVSQPDPKAHTVYTAARARQEVFFDKLYGR